MNLADRPLPTVDVDLGPTLPGWLLRVVLGVAAAGLLAAAAARTPALTAGIVIGSSLALVAFLVARPRPAVAAVTLVAAGMLLIGSAHAPFDPWALVLAPLGYVVVRAAWWADHVPLTARVEVAALAAGWRQDAAVLGGTLLLGAVALPVSGGSWAGGVLVGGVALVLLASLALPGQDVRDRAGP